MPKGIGYKAKTKTGKKKSGKKMPGKKMPPGASKGSAKERFLMSRKGSKGK